MKKFLSVLAILNLFQHFSFAQNKRVDSLLSLIKIAKEDTIKVKQLNNLCAEFIKIGSFNIAIHYGNSAYILGDKILSQSHSKIAQTNVKKIIAKSSNNIGVAYREQGDYPKALDFFHKALKIGEELGDQKGIAARLGNIGNLYYNQGEFQKASQYYFKALKIGETLRDSNTIETQSGNLGNVFTDQSEYEKNFNKIKSDSLYSIGLGYYLRALQIAEELNDQDGVARHLFNIGIVTANHGDSHKALEYYLKALRIEENLGDQAGIASTQNIIGSYYAQRKEFESAEKYLKNALMIADKINALSIQQGINQNLSQMYLEKEDYKNAFRHYHLYTIAKDSIFTKEKLNDLTRKEMNFEFEKKDASTRAEQQKKEELHIAALKQQTMQRNAFIVGFGLMIALAGVSYRSFRNKRKAHDIITYQKKLVEEKQKEMLDSINYAQRIQSAILAKEDDITKAFPQSFLLYRPKDIVAGDFYFFETTSTHVFYAAADCTGHGVPGALVSVVCANALTRCVKEFGLTEPGKILDKSRELVMETFRKSGQEVKDGMDISFCAFSIKSHANEQATFQWAGANNPLWYITSENEVHEIKGNKQPIGFHHEPKPFTTHTVQIQKNDKIYFFTDGYADQFGGEKGKKFKYSKLKELLLEICDKPMSEEKIILNEKFDLWKGNLEQVDDMCVIGIKFDL